MSLHLCLDFIIVNDLNMRLKDLKDFQAPACLDVKQCWPHDWVLSLIQSKHQHTRLPS